MSEDFCTVKYCVVSSSHWQKTTTLVHIHFFHVTDYTHHAQNVPLCEWGSIKHAPACPAVAFILVQRFHMCAPDAQRCSWLSVVILSWYAGAGSGAELPGLCLQHTQTRTAPQQLRHQEKPPSSSWVEFRTSVWLFLFVFLGVVWDYLFIHFCSDVFLLLFCEPIQSFEWLAGLNTYQRPSCVCRHTLSFP